MSTEVPIQIHSWPIEEIVVYARNPRKNDAAVDRMCASIIQFGFKIPCLIRSDGELIDGHLRLKAARKLQMTHIPVLLCDEWTPAQVKAFRLMVNRSASWADWDEDLLAAELLDLKTLEFDLSLTGFETNEIDDFLLEEPAAEDHAPPVPKEAVTCPERFMALREPPRTLRGCDGGRNRVPAFGRAKAILDGDRSSLWH